MKHSFLISAVCLAMLTACIICIEDNPEVGYRVGKVQGYKKIKSFHNSSLY